MAPGPVGGDRHNAARFLSGLPEGTFRRRLIERRRREGGEDPEWIPSAINAAADLIALGAPGWRLLESHDPAERMALSVLAEKVAARREDERKALASEIISLLGKSLK